MFTNLIESDSHRQEFKRRSSFFLATVAAYAVILFVAGIASIYAYDARLESLSTDMTLLFWVPPIPTTAANPPRDTKPIRRPLPTHAPTDRNATVSERTNPIASTNDPTKIPTDIGIKAPELPPIIGPVILSNQNRDPVGIPGPARGCTDCSGSGGPARVPETIKPPEPPVVKPKTQTLTTQILASRAISLPQPPYPPLAKQIHVQGAVPVQILVNEVGRVISAHAVSGSPFLTKPAEEAALRALFTPTILNGQPVKVQGVITYNFRLQ